MSWVPFSAPLAERGDLHLKYLLIDTNIWVRVISQGKPGCEIGHFDELRSLIEQSELTLLLPEVIQLEISKNWRSFTETVEVEIGKLEKELEGLLKRKLWTEIEDVQKSLREFFVEQKERKITAATARYEKVQALLASSKVINLPFTAEINFLGRKRIMAGRMPKPENSAHSDACIIETLASYFTKSPKESHELCFCSENVGDFGLAAKDRHIIHPLHKDELPAATEYCISLEQVIAFLKSKARAIAPSQEVINEALQQRTDDEVDAEIELERERKADSHCAEGNCFAHKTIFSKYCPSHTTHHLNRLTQEQRDGYRDRLISVLKTLTYRERELLKLRTGLGDGYIYTPSECGRIFKITPQRVGQIEAKAIRKLQHPMRRRIIDNLL